MGNLMRLPWHWWLMLALLVIAVVFFVLNFALGWDQDWIAIGGPIVTIVSCVYTFRFLWRKSASPST